MRPNAKKTPQTSSCYENACLYLRRPIYTESLPFKLLLNNPLYLDVLSCVFIIPSISPKDKFWSGIFTIMIFPPFILNPCIFPFNALLQNLHNLIFTPFSKWFIVFSLNLLLFTWMCYLNDNIICLTYSLVLVPEHRRKVW